MPDAGRRSHLRLVPAGEAPANSGRSRGRGGAERERLLRLAAARAAEREFYLAARLRRYSELEGIDEAELARRLAASASALTRLALCRAPDPAQPAFRQQVAAISTYAGVSATALMQLLRRVQVSEAARDTRADLRLLAARDRVLKDGETASPPADDDASADEGEPC